MLHLGKVNPETLPHKILQTVAIGIGPDEPRGDFRAPDRRNRNAECVLKNRDIKTAEMKQLQDFRVGKEGFQDGRIALAALDMDNVR